MTSSSAAKTLIAPDVVLDGRLALFHAEQRWLAVADLHFGYEISQRVAGRLMPLWGMASIHDRLTALIREHQPLHLIIVGDLAHDRSATAEASELLQQLRALCDVVVLSGNHDRQLAGAINFRASWESEGFYFHHGHCEAEAPGKTQIIGHHHPAATVRDGAGLRLKLPAFVQERNCWILPAFSPWAAGATWHDAPDSRVWLCTPSRILRLPDPAPAIAD